jgi:RNA polymerase sigma factor (sigma-70 family)
VWKEISERSRSDAPGVNWRIVVEQIRAGEAAGKEILYQTLLSGARLFLQRRLGTQDVEDRVHDLFVIIVETIHRGELREPERLMGFVRTVLNRQLSAEISQLIRTREHNINVDSAEYLTAAEPDPEEQAAIHQKVALMKRALRKLSERDFEVLTRFYLREQSPERIRLEMGLTETQFHLIKSRAKERLMRSIQRKLSRKVFNRK